jgi:hypothetical protein
MTAGAGALRGAALGLLDAHVQYRPELSERLIRVVAGCLGASVLVGAAPLP